jgi:hypothetical protein
LFRVIVAGSRNITSKDLIFKKLDYLLAEKIKAGEAIQIISGGARGVDKIGEEYAAARGFSCKRFPADWETFGKRAVYVSVPDDLPKTTHLSIDGKSLYIHRANYTILDADMLEE